jgi:hypothetical protein
MAQNPSCEANSRSANQEISCPLWNPKIYRVHKIPVLVPIPFDHFQKYHMNNLSGDVNAKVGEDIFKPTIGNKTLHDIRNNNVFRRVNFSTSKNVSIQCSHNAKIINIFGCLLTGKRTIRLTISWYLRQHSTIVETPCFRESDSDTDHYWVVADVKDSQ